MVLAIKDFFVKQRTPDNHLAVRPIAVSIDDMPADSLVRDPLQLAPATIDGHGPITSTFEPDMTDNVIKAIDTNADPRLKQIAPSLLRNIHNFCKEHEITVDEWTAATKMVS